MQPEHQQPEEPHLHQEEHQQEQQLQKNQEISKELEAAKAESYPIVIGTKNGAAGHEQNLEKIDPIKVDIPLDQFKFAVRVAQEALANEKSLRDVARLLKHKFDEKYEPLWHCVVGRNFGSYMSHVKGGIAFFYVDKIAILLFKTA